MSDYLVSVSKNYYPSKEENVVKSIFSQYESVIIYSLITSFGLDFLIKDQHGGDVDTIHNVRQIGKDPEMTYKNKQNQEDYENRGKYDSRSYHSNSNYIQKRNEIQQKKKDDTLTDAYTGEKLDSSSKVDLDHVMSAKEIHDDAGRVLADLSGEELANNPTNLQPTNAHTNRTKKADIYYDTFSVIVIRLSTVQYIQNIIHIVFIQYFRIVIFKLYQHFFCFEFFLFYGRIQ